MFSAYIYIYNKKTVHCTVISSTLLNSIAHAQCRMFVCTLELIGINFFYIIMNQTRYIKINNSYLFCAPTTCIRI